jgi:hypothetical protein
MEEIHFSIKRGLLDNRERKLIINPESIKFENKDSKSDTYTQFNKDSIVEYRYGIKWIEGIYFTIGREYQIFIRNNENNILKISFKSIYGLNKKEYQNKYAEIVNSIWNYFFSEISESYLTKFQNNEKFSIGNVMFTKNKLTIYVNGIIKEEPKTIPWEEVRTRDYQTYFAIYSIENPTNINRGYNYLNDWNTGVLYSVVRTILNTKKIEIIE